MSPRYDSRVNSMSREGTWTVRYRVSERAPPFPKEGGMTRPMDYVLQMIHPQVHLRIPCYDFSFL